VVVNFRASRPRLDHGAETAWSLHPSGKWLKPADHRHHPHPENLRWHRERVFGQVVEEGPLPWG